MNEQKKQKLLEQYDDAAFALLMDEYAEEEGARLMAEFEAAQAAGQVPQMPAELNERCRRMIRRDRAKKRGIRAARSFRKVAVKAAVAVLVFIGLITTVVMSVDALRIPVLNFIVEHYEKYISITTSNTYTHDVEDPCVLLDDLLPTEYVNTIRSIEEGMSFALYQNSNEDIVSLSITMAGTEKIVDSEGAICSEITLANDKALLIENNGYQVIWSDSNAVTYTFRATNLELSEVIKICYTLNANQ